MTDCEECKPGETYPPLVYGSDECGRESFFTFVDGRLHRWDPDGRVFVMVESEKRKGRLARFLAWIRCVFFRRRPA